MRTMIVSLVLLTIGAGCVEAKREGASSQASRKPTIEELEKQLKGKTQDEVIAAIGRPASTHNNSWRYDRITYNPVTAKDDVSSYFRWDRDGKLAKIEN